MKIVVNKFAKGRHLPEKPYSHFNGTDEELVELVGKFFHLGSLGYKEGVRSVGVPSWKFHTAIAEMPSVMVGQDGVTKDAEAIVAYRSRVPNEPPRFGVPQIQGAKTPAKRVEIILYASTVLFENKENDLPPEEGNWEIISINASPTDEEVPLPIMTLLYNHFHREGDGGTSTGWDATRFEREMKKSFRFWQHYVMLSGVKG